MTQQAQNPKPQATFYYYGKVSKIPACGDSLKFYSDSQDIESINQQFNIESGEFDSYFCEIDKYGDIIRLWGIEGIVPRIDKSCWLICLE